MQSASKGNQTYSYTYNSDGLRASKTVGNTTYHYYWNSGKLIAMTYDDHYMIFTYTESGTPFSVTCYDAYLDKEYECLYITNLQGDVVGIYDAAKSSMVISYTYDAWGRLVGKDGTSSDYAQLEMNNPLLYRGYQYDYETGFYYLQSRYYDPSVGRFLNADDTNYLGESGTLLGWNLFAYCENNFTNRKDSSGFLGLLACLGIGALIGALIGGTVSYVKYKELRVKWIVGGAVIGMLVAAGGYWVYNTYYGALASWSAYKSAQIGAGASASSATIGRMFEKFYYSFNNIASKCQQVVWKHFRFDAIFKGRIVELKNYDWTKYSSSQIASLAGKFATQGQKYLQAIGQYVGGQKINGITFYFSSKPPQTIIDALKKLGIAVDWVR